MKEKNTLSSYSYFFVNRFPFLPAHHGDKLFSVFDHSDICGVNIWHFVKASYDYNGTPVSVVEMLMTALRENPAYTGSIAGF